MPTVPTPETVIRVRYSLVVATRAIALVCVVLFAARALSIVLGARVFGPNPALYAAGFAPRDPVLRPIALAAVYPACALLLALVIPWLMRWLVPQPKPGCPFCDHEGLPETGSKCPECGRELPEQLRR